MIRLTHDYGFAYDLLAIAEVKYNKNLKNSQSFYNYTNLYNEIEDQIGKEKHSSIYLSKEYKNLYNINKELYEKIDDLKINGEQLGDAKLVDSMNYQRWQSKKILQEEWFKKEVLEQKFGYDKIIVVNKDKNHNI